MSFDTAPSKDKVKVAVRKMKKGTRHLWNYNQHDKNLPEEGFQILVSHIQQFWEVSDYDHKAWHKTKLMFLYKGKGKLEDPNNWRGICLKETSAKILSLILAKITTEPWKNKSRSKSIQSHQLPGSPSALILRCQCGLKT